ncbi:hypothetical protein C7B62_05315 [Pleurocapsa sp. CCALA 161]|uniref:hypothetical protein n=1 Tax=Pleurocapsa sp. CCALA 161 TaxID=2107688 RepID=UPI000D05573D|nr:hypothetical protein [Pleurocapsa sp. CCALA 161]PSB11553.1 hypothetical protein C7B62_05315 [Pleurocapsa sp. CCALA 161]
MTQDQDINAIDSISLLTDTAQDLCALAKENQNDSLFLLSLLRDLEQIHRQIRINYFESALPQTRHDLYQFVKDIEEKGGWPYIERMRLIDLLKNLELSEENVEQRLESEEV